MVTLVIGWAIALSLLATLFEIEIIITLLILVIGLEQYAPTWQEELRCYTFFGLPKNFGCKYQTNTTTQQL